MKYMVGVKIYNCFEVDADSEYDAEIQVREMDLYATFDDCDYNITYVDKVRDIDIPQEMCQDLLDRIEKKDNSYAPATKQAVEQRVQLPQDNDKSN